MKSVLLLMILMASSLCAQAQVDSFQSKSHRNFPLIVRLLFQNLALPFRDLKGNLSNLGIGVGTEISLNGKNNWVQQFNAMWYHNKNMGNGIMVFTQPAWRPHLGAGIYSELKLGAGYLYAFRPVKSFKQKNGDWISVGYKGKGMLIIPLGITIGYNKYSTHTYVSPFASYQFLLVNGYNRSIPLVPQTLIQVGSRIHLNYK